MFPPHVVPVPAVASNVHVLRLTAGTPTLALGDGDVVAAVADAEAVATVADALAEPLGDAAVTDALAEPLGEEDAVPDGVVVKKVLEADGEPALALDEGVADTERAVEVAEGEPLSVGATVVEGVAEGEPLSDGAPVDVAVAADADAEEVMSTAAAEAAADAVVDAEPEGEPEGVDEADVVGERADEGEAAADLDAVGEPDAERVGGRYGTPQKATLSTKTFPELKVVGTSCTSTPPPQ